MNVVFLAENNRNHWIIYDNVKPNSQFTTEENSHKIWYFIRTHAGSTCRRMRKNMKAKSRANLFVNEFECLLLAWIEKKKQRSNRRSNYQRSHSIWIAHLHRNLASTREFARQQWQINAAPNAWNIFIGCVLALSAGHCQPAKKNQKRKKNALKSVGFLILSSISLFCT